MKHPEVSVLSAAAAAGVSVEDFMRATAADAWGGLGGDGEDANATAADASTPAEPALAAPKPHDVSAAEAAAARAYHEMRYAYGEDPERKARVLEEGAKAEARAARRQAADAQAAAAERAAAAAAAAPPRSEEDAEARIVASLAALPQPAGVATEIIQSSMDVVPGAIGPSALNPTQQQQQQQQAGGAAAAPAFGGAAAAAAGAVLDAGPAKTLADLQAEADPNSAWDAAAAVEKRQVLAQIPPEPPKLAFAPMDPAAAMPIPPRTAPLS